MEATHESNIVLIHDWLTGMRGGEKCLEAACGRWPAAPLYTLLHHRGSVSPVIEDRPIRTSWLQRLPDVHRYYRYLLPLMPRAAGDWHAPACDAVLSFSHCVAKAACPPKGVPHICYCFTPMRYAWHMREAYFRSTSLKNHAIAFVLERLRQWDRRTADRVTHYIAISRTVQRRILECYHRPSTIIYPPVDTDFYFPVQRPRDDFFLVVSANAPYKRLDLAVAACTQLKRKLVVIGAGTERLRSAAGPTVNFLGWQTDEIIRDHMQRCQALLFPGEEDFGIVPLEAQACGAPVIAFGRGGATETVIPLGGNREPTGVWFEEQSAESLIHAIRQLERNVREFRADAARRNALTFRRERFAKELFAYVDSVLRNEELPSRLAA